MAETFNTAELVIPGTYIRVRAEGLIGVGGISTGNIGIVGTVAPPGEGQDDRFDTHTLSDYATAVEKLGRYDAYNEGAGRFNLVRGIELLFQNGARTVYARGLALTGDNNDQPPPISAYGDAFRELLNEDVNILVAPELATADADTLLRGIVDNAEGFGPQGQGKDLIAVVGSNQTERAAIAGQVTPNKRLVMVAPGIVAEETVEQNGNLVGNTVRLSGTYTAAAVAGLLSRLSPQSSPTNKVLSAVRELTQHFPYGDKVALVSGGVLVLERRQGIRVVRGISTEMATNGPFRQITTRRITDFAKAGIRQVSNPFIGRLNNQRVRAALYGAIDGFLTTMVQDEALTEYNLQVTATRDDEINGRAIVNAVLQPTFSIDFIAVTLVLQ